MKRTACVAITLTHLATCLPASADCISQIPRYVEMKVESCENATSLVQAAIVGKGYSLQEAKEINLSAASLYIIRARVLAEIDLIEWYSQGDIRRYVVRRGPVESKARDFMVVSHGGCEPLAHGSKLIFDFNPDKPCRDIVVAINGKQPKETDARLILTHAEVKYVSDQDDFEDMEKAYQRMQEIKK
jgi:hypothetical protein